MMLVHNVRRIIKRYDGKGGGMEMVIGDRNFDNSESFLALLD